jgi:hypothetical protein
MEMCAVGQFERQGFKFDVGSSMMFGLSDAAGGANLITRALANVGKRVQTVADPSQVSSVHAWVFASVACSVLLPPFTVRELMLVMVTL